MAHVFSSDDELHSWIRSNVQGYLLNVRRNPSSNYLVLHQVGCASLDPKRYEAGALTERSYRKVGASTPEDLQRWIRANVPDAADFSLRCSRCDP